MILGLKSPHVAGPTSSSVRMHRTGRASFALRQASSTRVRNDESCTSSPWYKIRRRAIDISSHRAANTAMPPTHTTNANWKSLTTKILVCVTVTVTVGVVANGVSVWSEESNKGTAN